MSDKLRVIPGEKADVREPVRLSVPILDFLRHEMPPTHSLLSPWLRSGGLTMVHAWRGIGKTHFGIGVACAVAKGGSFLKWTAPEPGRVLFVDGEMPGAAMLLRDQNVHGLQTLRQIIGDEKWGWAPASGGNDVGAYVRDVAQQAKLPTDSRLDLSNEITLSKLIAAMTHHENPKTAVSTKQVLSALKSMRPATVKVVVQNDTGGSAVIQGNMAAR